MTDADMWPVIPARWDRHPAVTHHHLTADGVDADAVLTGGLTLRRVRRHTARTVTRDAAAVMRGIRHLIAHDRHSEED
ncbi:hypothetical protein [Verrucosispora sp. NA02020]|uniref:hypothetical protein n=1 Tax=Verrucosispora sp. NA02020 TaxID=2742132 RepID=UPI0020CA7D86|nr:hypothetical protein [Verrucosispora sp. NA02020]